MEFWAKQIARTKKRRINRNRGFSLVELIIVIAIMAILVAAISPILIRYINKARKADDIAAADTIGATFQSAVSDDEKVYEWFSWCASDIDLKRLPRRQYRIDAFCAAPGAYAEQNLQLVTAYLPPELNNQKTSFEKTISGYLGTAYAPLRFMK